jgi:hypothetical protein
MYVKLYKHHYYQMKSDITAVLHVYKVFLYMSADIFKVPNYG